MPQPARAAPYWRMSGFYFFYYASLGALVPYWSVYLKALGFGPGRIGELIAIIAATKVVAPNIWGWMADRSGRGMQIVRLASLAALLSFAVVFFAQDFLWMALVMTAFSFFWNAALPQFEVNTFNHLGDQPHRYSNIRLWGSIGFIVTVVGTGALLGQRGPGILPALILLLFAAIWITSLTVPERSEREAVVASAPLTRVLRQGPVVALLTIIFLNQVGHGPYYAFFTIYMEQHGLASGAVGLLWALGVIAEVGVFLVMYRWLPRFGAGTLLAVAMGLGTLRWLVIAAAPEQIVLILGAQILHAASFGVVHAAAIHLVHRMFIGIYQGRGQALYSSLSFGAGGAVGSLMAGYLWEGFGGSASYLGAAAAAGLGTVVALSAVRAFNRLS
jgi:PPP family 3-phenylpropionic acid transporter